MKHIYEKHTDSKQCHPYPGSCWICDGGLGVCTVCGGAEGSLTIECPGVQMTAEQDEKVYAGAIDFKDGHWITPKPKK
jgi:hypothetical protein